MIAHTQEQDTKEGNVLFNDTLNTFYLCLYGIRHLVKDHSDSKRGNPLPTHGLLFPINSMDSFICIMCTHIHRHKTNKSCVHTHTYTKHIYTHMHMHTQNTHTNTKYRHTSTHTCRLYTAQC